MVEIVDNAVPNSKPVRPNKPLNLILGVLVGGFSGLVLATFLYWLQLREFRRVAAVPRTQFSARFRTGAHILIALGVGIIVGYLCASPNEFGTQLGVPLILFLGGCASAYIELANPPPAPNRTGAHPNALRS